MRSVGEHFCRNDSSNIIFTTQNSLLLLSEFSVDDRTRFFLLSLSIRRMHSFISSFFGKKEERNERRKRNYKT